MNYLAFFEQVRTRHQLEEFMIYIEQHHNDFEEVFKLVFIDDVNIAWRILWGCEKISHKWPEWYDEDKTQKVISLVLAAKHAGFLRIGLSILNALPAPDPINVELLNSLYDWMLSPNSSIAVQSSSMKLLSKYVSTDEDLLREFLISIELVDESLYTRAFVSSRRQILKRFNQHGFKSN